MGEVILSHVFEDLGIETSKSPEVSVFQRLKQTWDTFDLCELCNLDFSNLEGDQNARDLLDDLKDNANNALEIATQFSRDDYREMAQLCKFFISGGQHIKLRRPGAIHKARWMSKILYTLKICLLKEQIKQLPKGTVTTPQQQTKFNDFAMFIVYVYADWWLQCSSPSKATWLDL